MTDELRTDEKRDAIYAVLRDLGDTADEVAASLLRHNIRGGRKAACTCPIAMFLLKQFPDTVHQDWNVSGGHIIGPCGALQVPQSVRSFVIRFDAGIYPDLVAGEVAA